MRSAAFLIVLTCIVDVVAPATAETFYVNNRTGFDRNDGRVETPLSTTTGPVRSISRALDLAGPGDTIFVTNTGVPYYDNLSLQGKKHSGHASRPFTVLGNGATITGAMVIPADAWREVALDVWKVAPFRKGHFQLIRDGKALAEVRPQSGEEWTSLPQMQDHEWCVWRGSIYYKSERLVPPSTLNMSIARRSCGITVFAAHDIVISDLTIQHFRLDGVNLHDLAVNVQLNKLTLRENGRAGIAVGGSSTARVSGSDVERNRDHSILIQEAAAIALDDCVLDIEPTVRQR